MQANPTTYYQSLFEVYENALNGQRNHPLHGVRKAAMEVFSRREFPTRRDEDWKYTSVTPVIAPRYSEGNNYEVPAPFIEPLYLTDHNAIRLVFVNGQYSAHHSNTDRLPEGVSLLPLQEAYDHHRYQPFVKELLPEQYDTAFAALNMAFARNSFFLHVPKNTKIDVPIYCLHIGLPNDDAFITHPQMWIVAERNSELTFYERYTTVRDVACMYFNNVANRMILRENARIDHYKLQDINLESFQITNTTVYQDRNSTYSNYTVDTGGEIVRNNITAIQKDQGVMTNLYGTYLGSSDQHLDNQTFIDHAQAHCQSNELYKGILKDKAEGVFNGKVIVRQDAQKINAFQQNSTLVLSEKATMNTKPQLEIYADDVRCSHGATIGQLEDPAIFYLRSRGLSDAAARGLLQYAFVKEVIEHFPDPTIREVATELVQAKLEYA